MQYNYKEKDIGSDSFALPNTPKLVHFYSVFIQLVKLISQEVGYCLYYNFIKL